jgi:diguanylate cyclase (GGDEF)-like protein
MFAVLVMSVTIASPAMAQASDATRCSAQLPENENIEAWLANGPQWTCPANFSDLSTVGHAVQFRWDPSEHASPAFLISRIAVFESVTIFTKGNAGDWRGKKHAYSDINATYLNRQFAVPVEGSSPDATALVVVFKGLSLTSPLDYAELSDRLPGTGQSDLGLLIIIALVCGLILMPLLFDFVFWRVLKEPFILWHALFVCAIAGQLIIIAGLYLPALSLKISTIQPISVLCFGMLVVTGMMFIGAFLEKDALSATMRRWLVAGVIAIMVTSLLYAPGFVSLGRWPAMIYHAVGAPVALINLVVAIHAWRRGSRYIRFVIVGFAPLFLISVVRLVSNLIPGIPTSDMNGLFLIAVVIEASATAFGVAARFVQIKRERDMALSEAHKLGELAGRDSLTGLLNRRAIEQQFPELHRNGYETIALIDLDHFKLVNDTFGHSCGDDVLCAVAAALESDARVRVARIGGEEFLLLLNGKDALERAERLRQAITLRIAREVSSLEQPVTASMGVVCVPPGAMPNATFSDFYQMADKLLYEAKEQGRNRHVAERLQAFRKRTTDRRNQAAA